MQSSRHLVQALDDLHQGVEKGLLFGRTTQALDVAEKFIIMIGRKAVVSFFYISSEDKDDKTSAVVATA